MPLALHVSIRLIHILVSHSPPQAVNLKEGGMATFFTAPRVGASDENVSPPTTGHHEGQKWPAVSVGKTFFFPFFCLNEATAGTSRHIYP